MRRIAERVWCSAIFTRPRCARQRVRRCSRGATRRATGWRRSRSSSSASPGSRPDPLRERLCLRGARRAGVQHLLHRQVAPDARRGGRSRGVQGPMAAGAGFRALLRLAGRRDEHLLPGLVHDNHTVEAAGQPEDGYHLADDIAEGDSVHPGRQGRRPRQAVLHVPRAAGRPRAAPRPSEWADRYKGEFDQGYEAIRAGILERQKNLELGPAGRHRPLADQPARRAAAHLARRQAVAAHRHRAPVGFGVRRREAPVLAHGRDVRGLHLVLRRPDRPRDRLPRAVRPARQYADRRGLGQRGQWRGWPQRHVQRVGVLQRRAVHYRAHAPAHRRARHAGVEQPLQHRLGVGSSTRRSRTGSAGRDTRAVWRT